MRTTSPTTSLARLTLAALTAMTVVVAGCAPTGEAPADEATEAQVSASSAGDAPGTASTGQPGADVRDSAGVRIVEWAELPEAAADLEVEELFQHGARPGDYSFGRFGASALLADGRAAIADLGNGDIVVVSADGSRADILASKGEGEGQVGSIGGLWTTGGDTIWTKDGPNKRFSRYVGGAFDRSWSTEGEPSISLGLRAVGAAPDGDPLLTTSAFSPRFQVPWLSGHMVRYDLDAATADTVAVFDLAPRAEPGAFDPFSPFGSITAAGQRWIEARTDRPRLVWRDPDGSIVQELRWNPPSVRPVEQDWLDFQANIEANIRQMNPDLGEDVVTQLLQQQLAGLRPRPQQALPHFFPPVGDHEGRVWLPEYVPSRDAPRRYRLVGPDGTWFGEVTFPDGVELMGARGDRVLGRTINDAGVQSMVVYRLDIRPR